MDRRTGNEVRKVISEYSTHSCDRQRNKDDIVMQGSDGQTDGARAAVWLHVFTAEHKLKKPRPLSHTPLGPKLYGVLHSTHKQPPGNVWKRQKDSGWTGEKQQLHNTSKLQRETAETSDGDLNVTD